MSGQLQALAHALSAQEQGETIAIAASSLDGWKTITKLAFDRERGEMITFKAHAYEFAIPVSEIRGFRLGSSGVTKAATSGI